MIDIYTKFGFVVKKPIISFILKSQKHRWLKTEILNKQVTQKQLECIGLLYTLKHVKKKYKKKKVRVYTDSNYLKEFLKKSKHEYVKGSTSVDEMKSLRDVFDEFNNIRLKDLPPPSNEEVEELLHVHKECGLDEIELNEKE